MSTLVVSDLHLGGRTGADVLREPRHRAALVDALDGVGRLVLLGDVLELRHGPLRDVLAVAEPVLAELGAALEPGAEVVLVPGNHDHALLDAWLERRTRSAPPRLELEHRVAAPDASWGAERVAAALGVPTSIAYPGVWLREDVYATHGHYLDLHSEVPNFERIAAGVTMRMTGPLPESGARPEDYEARLAPVYAWVDALAAHAGDVEAAAGAGSAHRAYRALTATEGRTLRQRAFAGAFPLGIAALNKAGLGPLSPDLSGPALRRTTLEAMHEVVRRLGIGADHVIFGHSHRKGPLPGDLPAEWGGLLNCGCWVFETHLMSGPDPASPYWPGSAVRVDDAGPPRLECLLGELG